MAEHFPGGVLAFDTCNKLGAKLARKTWPEEMVSMNVRLSA